MSKMISNIVFTKNRPLQLEAYLDSLYKHFPSDLIQTYIIYKFELFAEEYNKFFNKFKNCVVVRETDFHNDFIRILERIRTKYVLFGVDDVVFYDSVDLNVVEGVFAEQEGDIFGFTLRFGPESLSGSDDVVTTLKIAGQRVYRLNWKQGQTPHTRYPFELCCTFYAADLVRRIVFMSMNNNLFIRKMFSPTSSVVSKLKLAKRKRSTLKRFGYFFNPNTLESWPCRWCRNHKSQVPDYTFFQKQCASAIQVNIVNTSTQNAFEDTAKNTVESLNKKYRQGYILDIDYVAERRPTEPQSGRDYLRLVKREPSCGDT